MRHYIQSNFFNMLLQRTCLHWRIHISIYKNYKCLNFYRSSWCHHMDNVMSARKNITSKPCLCAWFLFTKKKSPLYFVCVQAGGRCLEHAWASTFYRCKRVWVHVKVCGAYQRLSSFQQTTCSENTQQTLNDQRRLQGDASSSNLKQNVANHEKRHKKIICLNLFFLLLLL